MLSYSRPRSSKSFCSHDQTWFYEHARARSPFVLPAHPIPFLTVQAWRSEWFSRVQRQTRFWLVIKTMEMSGNKTQATRLSQYFSSVCNSTQVRYFKSGLFRLALFPTASQVERRLYGTRLQLIRFVRFAGKFENQGLLELDPIRIRDSWPWPKRTPPLGARMHLSLVALSGRRVKRFNLVCQ